MQHKLGLGIIKNPKKHLKTLKDAFLATMSLRTFSRFLKDF